MDTGRGFQGCTVHWISSHWKLRSWFLGINRLQGGHKNTEALTKSLLQFAHKYDIRFSDENAFFAHTTDMSGADHCAAEAESDLSRGCVAHLINSVAKKLLADDKINTLLTKAKNLVTAIKGSNKMCSRLDELVKYRHALAKNEAKPVNASSSILRVHKISSVVIEYLGGASRYSTQNFTMRKFCF